MIRTISYVEPSGGLNCLSGGSVSLTFAGEFFSQFEGESQLPFGWVCFSNVQEGGVARCGLGLCLNCLSAGSVSLTCMILNDWRNIRSRLNCLSAGSVSLTFLDENLTFTVWIGRLNCLSAGSVSLTGQEVDAPHRKSCGLNCLSAGSVSLTNYDVSVRQAPKTPVSIAFRLGLFL